MMPDTCVICSNDSFTKPFDNGRFSVVECKKCKYGRISPIPSDSQLEALYNSKEYFATHMDYDYDSLTAQEIEKNIKNSFRLHHTHLSPYLKNAKTMLEIGPGGGFSLKGFEQAGLQVQGVETSAASVQFATSKLHLPIMHSGFEAYQDTNQYDIVMLNHVLEHFVNLPKAMQSLQKLVKPSGILYIRVPDHDSYDRRAFGAKWPAYLPFHISYFSEQSLRELLNTYGFEVLEVKRYVSEMFLVNFPSFIQKLFKRIVEKVGLIDTYSGRTITIIAKKK